jgi:hypothetical protein
VRKNKTDILESLYEEKRIWQEKAGFFEKETESGDKCLVLPDILTRKPNQVEVEKREKQERMAEKFEVKI